MTAVNHSDIQQFAQQHHIAGLTEPSIKAIINGNKDYSLEKAGKFLNFQQRLNRELLQHPIITHNAYCRWFAKGEQTLTQLQAFIIQFSVFSNQFIVAQLQKVINADSLEGMRASKEILANEIGVVFNTQNSTTDLPQDIPKSIVSSQGSIEGGTFHFKAAHFEWLLKTAEKVGLTFEQIGRRIFAEPSTLFYCDELIRLYGSQDYMTSQAASYAVENWAAAGFWKELTQGFKTYNQQHTTQIPIGFFVWHDQIEDQHALHTQEELEELFFSRTINENKFIQDGNEMLNGVMTFWNGLELQRKSLKH